MTFVSASASGKLSTTPTDNKVLCNLGTINGGSARLSPSFDPDRPRNGYRQRHGIGGRFFETTIAPR